MGSFQAQRRSGTSGKPHQLRREGWIPMALISRDHGTTLLQAQRSDVKLALHQLDGHGRIDLTIADEKGTKKVIVKHVDNDPLRGGILNVTLQEVGDKDVMKLDVPVVSINHPADSESQGAVLNQPTTHIKLQGKMSDLPAHVEVDVSGLTVGHHINAGDIVLPNGVKLVSSPDATLFGLQVLRAVSLEPDVPVEPIEGEAPAAAESSDSAAE